MPSTSVEISEKSHELLRELSQAENQPAQEILARALESYRRQRFLIGANADYEALRQDRPAWDDELRERRLFEGTLADDLDKE